MQETTTYVINYFYDNVDINDKYKFVLKKSETYTGNVGDTISYVTDYASGLYFRTRDNLPLTLSTNTNWNIINIYYSSAYREYIYNLAYNALTSSVANSDVNVFLKLLGIVNGDLYMQARNIDDVIDIDSVDEEHLRHLSKLIDYPWSEALTADRQRESIKFYLLLRKMRGTNFAITNLIRIFGQAADTLYQPTDSTGVRVIEYYEGNNLDMYPGDIRIEIPELSRILRDAIEDVKLMGTRLVFAYRIPVDSEYTDEYGNTYGYRFNVGFLGKLTYWLVPGLTGWTEKVNFDKKLNESFDNQLIYKYRDTYKLHGGIDVIQKYAAPYINLWMFQEYGLRNIRGVVLNDGIIYEDLFLYR